MGYCKHTISSYIQTTEQIWLKLDKFGLLSSHPISPIKRKLILKSGQNICNIMQYFWQYCLTFCQLFDLAASFLDNSNPLLCTGSCIAIGEIGRNGCLPIPNGSLTQETKDDKGVEESTAAKKGRVDKKETWTKALVVEKLVAKLESSKISTKVGLNNDNNWIYIAHFY